VRLGPNLEFSAARSLMKFITKSTEETVELGRKIGKTLQPNDVVALIGDLGAGKTTLAQGIAQGLGVKEYVTSPTFIIINEHQGRIPLYHIDLYRLETPGAIEDLGIQEYFSKGGVCVIEWAERLGELRPSNIKSIEIKVMSEDERRFIFFPDIILKP